MTVFDKIILAIFNPYRLFIAIWKSLGWGSFGLRVRYDAVHRPHYAYGIYNAAIMAKRLGIPRISIIEMGVAGGNGLLVAENHAQETEKETGVRIEVYGFDAGTGLPPPVDYRDMPHVFSESAYPMDRVTLEKKLQRSALVIGNVSDTIQKFAAEYNPAPIGFVAFDLDLYSSTKEAFRIFDLADKHLLPRIFCYFDDITGNSQFMMNEWIGEFAAIKEFNESHARSKIGPIYGIADTRQFPPRWGSRMFSLHKFDHPLYQKPVDGTDDGICDLLNVPK
jgi:hypothetical protein